MRLHRPRRPATCRPSRVGSLACERGHVAPRQPAPDTIPTGAIPSRGDLPRASLSTGRGSTRRGRRKPRREVLSLALACLLLTVAPAAGTALAMGVCAVLAGVGR